MFTCSLLDDLIGSWLLFIMCFCILCNVFICLHQQQKQEKAWLGASFRPENFVPGLVIGFILGLLFDLSKPITNQSTKKTFLSSKVQKQLSVSSNGDQELKMVCYITLQSLSYFVGVFNSFLFFSASFCFGTIILPLCK